MTILRLPSSTSSLRATKFSATRLPTSCGEVPAGHLLKYDCAATGRAAERIMVNTKSGAIRFVRCKVILLLLKCSYYAAEHPARGLTGATPVSLLIQSTRCA